MAIKDFDDVQRLIARLDEEAKKLGLYIQDVAVVPPAEGRPLLVQAFFVVGERAVEATKDEDQARIDQEFADLMRASKKDDVDDIRRQLEADFKDGKGLFGKDE